MGTAGNNRRVVKLPPLGKFQKLKNYAHSEALTHTFETLSNLHKLLPNHLMELLHSYKSEEDQKKCENPEFSGLERILARHQFPKEINLTPKPSRVPSWKRKVVDNVSDGWKKCNLWKRNIGGTKDPPMSTIVVRWLKKNMQPTEDLRSVICRLSAFGPIHSVTVCGRQSAIVVFKDTTSACNAVSAFQSRIPGTMLQCSWQHRFMSKDKSYSRKCSQKTEPKKPKQETEENTSHS
ncbi:testis expressed protein 56 [Microcebus murinus]|uniref:testis expressed protein 56 n=1 Tax=Microcebus murinus TaxID=30608 RepID=UPI0006437F7B|nr:uncharacterized protein C6orf201 homolog [Microcebus murinus]